MLAGPLAACSVTAKDEQKIAVAVAKVETTAVKVEGGIATACKVTPYLRGIAMAAGVVVPPGASVVVGAVCDLAIAAKARGTAR